MIITRTQIGRILGFVLLVGLVLGLSYGVTAFVTWQLNPGQWSPVERACAVFFALCLPVLRGILSNITVVNDADEERR